MRFPERGFSAFCSHLVIDSKEQGLVPLRLLGTQRYLLDEIKAGLSRDIHKFVILKGRQQGITTLTTALDLFWQMRHPGMQGAMVADDESNRDHFKSLIGNYLLHLPNAYKVPVQTHNRNQLVFANRSRVSYLVAGSRRKAGLGQGKGLNFCHGTEVSSWGDEEGFMSLMASLAENHPERLYVFESTAKGLNFFYDLWQEAEVVPFTQAIFIAWWRMESYAYPEGSKEYQVYWGRNPAAGRILPEEREWVRDVKRLYKVEITPGQMAWWRFQLHEKFQGDERMLHQEHPPTPEYAFQTTGSQFFPSAPLLQALQEGCQERYEAYRYSLGSRFVDTQVEADADGELRIWEEPKPNGIYVLGADPAYGSSEWKDKFSIQILRCYADGCEQVAEYASPHCSMTGFAWIIAHLAGAYRNTTVILEVNGPGRGVLDELQKMPFTLMNDGKGGQAKPELLDLLGSVRHYLFHRADSLAGGYALHWSTNANTKPIMMNGLRDAFLLGRLKVRSERFVEEAKSIIQDGNYIGGEGRSKDDNVIAMALAVQAWREQVQPELMGEGLTREVAVSRIPENPDVQQLLVQNYLRNLVGGKLHPDPEELN